MAREARIIRGDAQTIPVSLPPELGDLTGATAYLFVKPRNAAAPDTIIDPTALITSQVTITSGMTSLDFELVSTSGEDNSSLIPVGTYSWYVRIDNSGEYTTIQLRPDTVEVIAPSDGDC